MMLGAVGVEAGSTIIPHTGSFTRAPAAPSPAELPSLSCAPQQVDP